MPTYRPDAGVPARVSALGEQTDGVIVVDDGSGPRAHGILDAIEAAGTTVLRLPENRGIAAALNAGSRVALERGADFVLHSDQDTDFPSDYVAVALAVFEAAHPVTRLGIVSNDGVNGAPALPAWISPEGLGLVPEAIQTGMLIRRECFEVAGMLDERLVIDCVDTEYSLRVHDAGYRIAIARGTDIGHSLGQRMPARVLWIPLRHRGGRVARYEYHEPFRRYYITRNNLDLVLRNLRRRPRWCVAVMKRNYSTAAMSILSGPRSGAQALATLAGIVHGLLRRRGMIPPALAAVLRR